MQVAHGDVRRVQPWPKTSQQFKNQLSLKAIQLHAERQHRVMRSTHLHLGKGSSTAKFDTATPS